MDMHALEIAFNLPFQYPKYRSKPAGYLSHMIGHEGPGSLHSYCKQKGWLVGLEAGSSPLGRGFDAFRITLMMTPEGTSKFPLPFSSFLSYSTSGHWREVLIATYKYISMLKSSKLEDFHHREIQAMSSIRYRFKEKRRPEEYVTTLSDVLQRPYTRDCLLSAPSLVWEYDESEIREILDLLDVSTGRVMLMAKAPESLSSTGTWLNEQWYGTQYQVEKLPQDLVGRASMPNDIPELFLPGPNPFIPVNLEVQRLEGAEVCTT